MALQLRKPLDGESATGWDHVDAGWVKAVRDAQDAYRAAVKVLKYDARKKAKEAEVDEIEKELRASLSAEAATSEKMEYNDACRWITGEDRRDRAVAKFTKFLFWLFHNCYWIDEENMQMYQVPKFRTRGFIYLREVAEFRREFKNFQRVGKKELARILVSTNYEPDAEL